MRPAGRPLVVASNRGPVTFDVDAEGAVTPKRGAGGLVSALGPVLAAAEGVWIASAMSEGDRVAAERGAGRIAEGDDGLALRYLAFEPEVFDGYYNQLANRILWFCHHYLWDVPRAPHFDHSTRRAWQHYRIVNEAFAAAVAEEAARFEHPACLVQDYQLALVPGFLRERLPDASVLLFWHVPFAGPEYLAILPDEIRVATLEGMLGADVVAFHTDRWADRFLAACAELEGADPDRGARVVRFRGREIRVAAMPIPIDAEELRRHAESERVEERRRAHAQMVGDRKLVFRADRMELSKNIVRGFGAYERLLREHPEWHGRVTFLAHLYESRLRVPDYRVYAGECITAVERVNEEFGRDDWRPIELMVRDDWDEVLAGYRDYDVLLVNPVFDGLNLVAKEGPAVNRRDGVLVLSRNAGVFDELEGPALPVNPFDELETAEMLHAALTMPADERASRAKALREIVDASRPRDWGERQVEALSA